MSERPIPVPPGLAYLPFQIDCIKQAREWENLLIADEQGLGKTIEASGILNDSQWRRALLICPASLRLNWQRELAKWLAEPRSIAIADRRDPCPGADVAIASYDHAARWGESLKARPWDWLVCDECQAMSNPRSLRAVQILGRRRYRKLPPVEPIAAARKLFLTGTPIVNRPLDIQPVLAAIDRWHWGDRLGFARRYCAGRATRWGWDLSGDSRLRELERRLRHSCMVRRRKADVLAELPPKRRQIVELPAESAAAAAIEAERCALGLETAALLDATTPRERAVAVERLAAAARLRFNEIAAARKAIGLAKVEAACEFAISIAESGSKAVLFAHHLAVIDAIAERLGSRFKTVALDGRRSASERDRAVRDFQHGDASFFVGGIRAAGVGLTLTAAQDVVFAELDWAPGQMAQCEDRIHRIGQRGSALSRWLVLEGSVDALVCETLHSKSEVIDEALDGIVRREDRSLGSEQLALGL